MRLLKSFRINIRLESENETDTISFSLLYYSQQAK